MEGRFCTVPRVLSPCVRLRWSGEPMDPESELETKERLGAEGWRGIYKRTAGSFGQILSKPSADPEQTPRHSVTHTAKQTHKTRLSLSETQTVRNRVHSGALL